MSRPRAVDRAAICLHFAAGMPKRAIARQLGIAESSVFSVLQGMPRPPRLTRCEMRDRVLAARLGWPGLWSREAVCLLALEQHPAPWATAEQIVVGVDGLRDLMDLPGSAGITTIERVLAGLVAQGYVVRIGGARTRAKYLLSDRARQELRRRGARGRIPAAEVPVVHSYAYDQ